MSKIKRILLVGSILFGTTVVNAMSMANYPDMFVKNPAMIVNWR